MLDFDSAFGKRVAKRLKENRIIWLTTTGSDGTPQPRPVWFLWDGEKFLIFSRPDTHKLRHIADNPRVALNLDGDGMGGDIVVFAGVAKIDRGLPPANEVAAYVEKYQDGFANLGMSDSDFADAFSVPIVVMPVKLRGQ